MCTSTYKFNIPSTAFLSHALLCKLLYFIVPYAQIERCHNQVVRVAWLWCSKLLEDCEFKAGLCHPMAGKLALPTQQ